jgi:hypothetical protein
VEAAEAEQVFMRVERQFSHARGAVAEARRAVKDAHAVAFERDGAVDEARETARALKEVAVAATREARPREAAGGDGIQRLLSV